MSHHWHDWQFTGPLGDGYRTSSIGTHRVAVMVEAYKTPPSRDWDPWVQTKDGRTVCGQRFSIHALKPSAIIRDPFECWTIGWRPCSRCFPEFDINLWHRIRQAQDRWYSKGEKWWDRLDHFLWQIVEARRARSSEPSAQPTPVTTPLSGERSSEPQADR